MLFTKAANKKVKYLLIHLIKRVKYIYNEKYKARCGGSFL